MNGMNFEEWQALMRAQRNGGTSSEIHNHEAVISNKNPNSESGNAAADELRAKQRYHNEQSKGMATDRKEEVAPSRDGVEWCNVLAQDYMLATYQGKLIKTEQQSNQLFIRQNQDEVDVLIASGSTWPLQSPRYMPVGIFKHKDGSPITDADTIPLDSVPQGSDYSINVELAFIFAPS